MAEFLIVELKESDLLVTLDRVEVITLAPLLFSLGIALLVLGYFLRTTFATFLLLNVVLGWNKDLVN